MPNTPIRPITSGPSHHWFGYYAKLQFDPGGRYLLGPDEPVALSAQEHHLVPDQYLAVHLDQEPRRGGGGLHVVMNM